jgi:DNA-sulfur modification-associated
MGLTKKGIVLDDVSRIRRPANEWIYRAPIDLETLYHAIVEGDIQYSPRYQRGYDKWANFKDNELDSLLSVTDDKIQIKNERAIAMAIKFLQGRLYTAHLVWNARRGPESREPEFDPNERTLTIFGRITVPDTAHRHRAHFWLVHWKLVPEEIPEQVEVDGTVVTRDEIENLLDGFDPSEYQLHVDVYTLEPPREGFLYDEFNADSKAPSTAVAIALNPEKTPSRRFVTRLIEESAATNSVLSTDEVEMRGNVIGAKSRKLTTIATLEAAARNMAPKGALDQIERERPESHKELVAFFNAFFEEWAQHFPAFLAGKTYQERWAFRAESYALSNIMFHPLFKLAFEMWTDMDANDEDFRAESDWKDALARLAAKISVEDVQDDGTTKTIKVPVMSQRNPAWENLILVPRFDRDGNKVGAIISSTTQTRAAAFSYLRKQSRF